MRQVLLWWDAYTEGKGEDPYAALGSLFIGNIEAALPTVREYEMLRNPLMALLRIVADEQLVLSGIPQAPAVAAALAIGAMKLTDTVHPPAAPYAFVFASSKWGVQQIFAPGLLGAVLLVAIHKVWIVATAAIKGSPKAKAA